MRNEEIKINETYWTRVSGVLVRVKVIGETKGFRNRRAWKIIRVDNNKPLEPRNAQALHLTKNPEKEREDRALARDEAKENKIRKLNRQRFRHCPHCGRTSASPVSNLCGDALMGRACNPFPPGCEGEPETPPVLDPDADTVDHDDIDPSVGGPVVDR